MKHKKIKNTMGPPLLLCYYNSRNRFIAFRPLNRQNSDFMKGTLTENQFTNRLIRSSVNLLKLNEYRTIHCIKDSQLAIHSVSTDCKLSQRELDPRERQTHIKTTFSYINNSCWLRNLLVNLLAVNHET